MKRNKKKSYKSPEVREIPPDNEAAMDETPAEAAPPMDPRKIPTTPEFKDTMVLGRPKDADEGRSLNVWRKKAQQSLANLVGAPQPVVAVSPQAVMPPQAVAMQGQATAAAPRDPAMATVPQIDPMQMVQKSNPGMAAIYGIQPPPITQADIAPVTMGPGIGQQWLPQVLKRYRARQTGA